jgi:hypothetical protein
MIRIDGVKHKLDAISSNATVFFARELEDIDAVLYEIKKKELVYRQFIPVSNRVNAGADSYTYRMFDKVGMAKIISDYADDLPRADVFGSELTSKIKTLGSSFGYSTQEVRAASMNNVPLETWKASAARRAIHEQESEIAWRGNDDSGLPGFLNNENIPITAAPAGVGGTTWVLKTADEIIADITLIITQIRVNSKKRFSGDTMLLPIAQWNIIATTPRSTVSDITILDFLTKPGNSFGLTTIESIPDELDSAFTGGTEDGAMVYEKNSEVLEQMIPLEMITHPVQERGLEFVIPVESRHGGTVLRYPIACAIMTGI